MEDSVTTGGEMEDSVLKGGCVCGGDESFLETTGELDGGTCDLDCGLVPDEACGGWRSEDGSSADLAIYRLLDDVLGKPLWRSVQNGVWRLLGSGRATVGWVERGIGIALDTCSWQMRLLTFVSLFLEISVEKERKSCPSVHNSAADFLQ